MLYRRLESVHRDGALTTSQTASRSRQGLMDGRYLVTNLGEIKIENIPGRPLQGLYWRDRS
jgi:hypothetical protein